MSLVLRERGADVLAWRLVGAVALLLGLPLGIVGLCLAMSQRVVIASGVNV